MGELYDTLAVGEGQAVEVVIKSVYIFQVPKIKNFQNSNGIMSASVSALISIQGACITIRSVADVDTINFKTGYV